MNEFIKFSMIFLGIFSKKNGLKDQFWIETTSASFFQPPKWLRIGQYQIMCYLPQQTMYI
jgi:hypothetical protein